MNINIKKLDYRAILPTYAHGAGQDAGMDLYAMEAVMLAPMTPTLVRTGFAIEIPFGFEGQIRPRSGMALKEGVTVWNAPGTVDSCYRGEVMVMLLWNGDNPNAAQTVERPHPYLPFCSVSREEDRKTIEAGTRIAQLVISRCEQVGWQLVDELSETERGQGGFGSSGK